MWVAVSQSRPPRQSRDKENLKFQKSQFLCLCPSLSLPLSLSPFLPFSFGSPPPYTISTACHCFATTSIINRVDWKLEIVSVNSSCYQEERYMGGGDKNTGQIWIYALGSPQSIFINFINRTSMLKGLSVRYIMPSKSFKRGKIHSFINSSKKQKRNTV